MELTGFPVANASLLDEATSAAEALQMSYNIHQGKRMSYFVSENLFPQTLDVLKTKCDALKINLVIGDADKFDWSISSDFSGMMI